MILLAQEVRGELTRGREHAEEPLEERAPVEARSIAWATVGASAGALYDLAETLKERGATAGALGLATEAIAPGMLGLLVLRLLLRRSLGLRPCVVGRFRGRALVEGRIVAGSTPLALATIASLVLL